MFKFLMRIFKNVLKISHKPTERRDIRKVAQRSTSQNIFWNVFPEQMKSIFIIFHLFVCHCPLL